MAQMMMAVVAGVCGVGAITSRPAAMNPSTDGDDDDGLTHVFVCVRDKARIN